MKYQLECDRCGIIGITELPQQDYMEYCHICDSLIYRRKISEKEESRESNCRDRESNRQHLKDYSSR